MSDRLTIHKGLVMMAACQNAETYAAAYVSQSHLPLLTPVH